jgi:hypothetical protein
VRVNLKFTNKGQVAIENFNNDELIEIFTRYINTLMKKYAVDITVPTEVNQNIAVDGNIKVSLENVKCDVDTFFKELGRDIKIPLKKRIEGKLDTVFKIEVLK